MRLWRRALSFHLRHLPQMLVILPLLIVPVLGDALHSVLIGQERETGRIEVLRAVREAARITLPLAAMKIAFEGAAIAWAVIPIYGVIQGMRHRLFWAMASNVVVFERLTGEAGRSRCRAIANGDGLGLALWTLVKLPAVFVTIIFALWLGITTLLNHGYAGGLLAAVIAVLWLAGPGSAAVNTFLYLDIVPGLTSPDPDVAAITRAPAIHPVQAPLA